MTPRILKGNPSQLSFKRSLRYNMTEPEKLLWSRLRSKQFNFLKFRKQHGIGPYIVDFYCPEKLIVIEIDGETHGEKTQVELDRQRDEYLSSIGVKVVRYTNREIMQNLEGVLGDLEDKIKK